MLWNMDSRMFPVMAVYGGGPAYTDYSLIHSQPSAS